jgi:NMD protein affecting ribosome stability and mRNA decay
MAYCCRCGVYADLDDAKMCGTCRDGWQPTGSKPDDLGTRHPGAP